MGIPLAKTCGFAKEVPSDKVNDQVPGDLRVEDGYGFLVSLRSIWCGQKVDDAKYLGISIAKQNHDCYTWKAFFETQWQVNPASFVLNEFSS